MERELRRDPNDATFSVEPVTSLPEFESRPQAGNAPTPAQRHPPRPDKGLPLAEALDETVRDHHAVLAAPAKQAVADPCGLTEAEVLEVDERQLAEHDGPPGLRD